MTARVRPAETPLPVPGRTTESPRSPGTRTGRRAATGATRKHLLVTVAVTVLAPVAVFYGSRALGASTWLALVLGVVPALAHAVFLFLAARRLDRLALLTVLFLIASALVSLLDGDPRFLIAKDGWITAFVGVAILWTLRGTPFYLLAIRSLAGDATRARVDTAWNDSAEVRHILRIATAIWGIGLVADAGLRFWVAYTVPLSVAPLVNGLQYAVVFAALELGSQIYLRVAGRGLSLG